MHEAVGRTLTLAKYARADLERKERQMVNTISPINQLPNEVLAIIFEEALSPREDYPPPSSFRYTKYSPTYQTHPLRPDALVVCQRLVNAGGML